MAENKGSLVSVRFQDFELDLHSGELRKAEAPTVRLPEQSFVILRMLLEHSGKVVSRTEIQQRLWPDGTVVEFEHSIGAAMNRLRQALDDSAEKPQFIETLPRRGYRWMTGAEWVADAGPGSSLVTEHRTLPGAAPKQHKYQKLIAIACIFAASLALVGAIVWRSLPTTPRVTKVVPLTNDAKAKIPTNLLVTDGVHLYFVEGTLGAGEIGQVSAIGGETTQILTPLKAILAIYDISPNFSELLVANGVFVQSDPATGRATGAAEVWAQPLPAGTPHRVGNIYATTACYTRDGLQILYADGHVLMLINTDGTNPRELAKVQGVVRGIRYSPDGKRIRFEIEDWPFDVRSLWEMDANGKDLHPLLANWKESPFQCCASWSPDGSYYFFEAGHGNDQSIWVRPEHRFIFSGGPGSPSRLISGPLRLSGPVPSANGKKLFVVGTELRVEPVRYDSKTLRFESYLNGISANLFEFSPDRKWIAYVSYPDMSLWRSREDGTSKVQLTFPPVRVYGPRWSPDGSQIAFSDVHFDRPWSASVISSSGGPPKSLTGGEPNWMPDGKSIVYGKAKDSSTPEGREHVAIFRQDLDSGRITSIPDSEKRFSPRVSPDGRYISAFSQASTELSLFDMETGRWFTLAKGELFGYNLWSHDSKYVYMRDFHAGSPRIVRVRIRDGIMEEVVSLKDLPQLVDIFTLWFGLTPEGDPVVIRDRSTQEIYALDLQ